MALPERIDLAWVRRVVDRQTGEATGLRLCDTIWRRAKRNGEKAGTVQRSWTVDGHDLEVATIEEALAIRAALQTAREAVLP